MCVFLCACAQYERGKGLQRLAQEVGGDSKVISIQFFLPGAFSHSVQK